MTKSSEKNYIKELLSLYDENKIDIRKKISEFENFLINSNDEAIFHELCFCILSSGVGPKIAEKSLNAIKNDLWDGNENEIIDSLRGVHKYPEKASYLILTRDYLRKEIDLKLKSKVLSFQENIERRDYFANNKNIKGLGYVQASHFLRNIGFKGYAILDKNIITSLFEFNLLEAPKSPTSKKKYIEVENLMSDFAEKLGITIDELDLLLWTRKRGYIPK